VCYIVVLSSGDNKLTVHVVCYIVVLSSGDNKLTVHVVCYIVVLSSGESKLTVHTYMYIRTYVYMYCWKTTRPELKGCGLDVLKFPFHAVH